MSATVWFSILIGTAAKSTAVLGVAWFASRLLRTRSAAARHMVWTAAFAAILALPFLSAGLPTVHIPRAGAMLASPSVFFTSTATASANTGAVHAAASGAAPLAYPPGSWRPDWIAWLLLLWAAGTAAAFAGMAVAYAAVCAVRRSAAGFPDGDLCHNLALMLGIHRPVDLLQSRPGSMPMAIGLRRAAILMPADAALWSEERRRSVLLHELAHVRRHEAATHLLARTARALYWWHPLAWLAWREFLKERERAADDLVLNVGTRASEYAGHLLEVARTMRTPVVIAWAAAAAARRSQLEGRLRAILDPGADRSAPRPATVWAAALLAAALVLPLAALRAQDDRTQSVPGDIDAAISVARSQKNYEMLESAAQAATQSRKYDAAQKLLEAALAIRAETAGGQGIAYGVGLVKLAELKQKTDWASGADLYAKAAQILGERPEAARALIHMGVAALSKKDYTHAFEYFQHAQLVDPAQAGTALMWMAAVRQKEADPEDAERLYQSALAAQVAKPDDAALVMRVYSQFLRAQGRADESSALEARAISLQKANAGAAPAIPAGVYRIGKGVAPPSVDHKTEPAYTEEARIALLQGTVVVQVVVGADGMTHDTHVIRSLGLGLDENALEAIGQWQFKPAAKDGQPVAVVATIEVNYRLL